MRQYELVLVMRPSLTEDKRKKLIDSVKTWLKDVKFLKEEALGQKPLAYQINRETSGYYYYLSFEGKKVSEDLEKRILAQESVVRHLLVRTK